MILDTKKNQVSKCDFCKEKQQQKKLTLTGEKRYDPAIEKFGREAICSDCKKKLRGY